MADFPLQILAARAKAQAAQNTTLVARAVGKIDTLALFVIISETHDREAEVTEHPVETGSDIADHRRVKPATLTMESAVTNTPFDGQTHGLEGPDSQRHAAFLKLEELYEENRLFAVVTKLKVYDNMVITHLSYTRDRTTGEALRFTANLKAIKFVTNRVIAVKNTADGRGSKVSKGPVAPKQVIKFQPPITKKPLNGCQLFHHHLTVDAPPSGIVPDHAPTDFTKIPKDFLAPGKGQAGLPPT